MKVLVCDPASQEALNYLSDNEIKVVYKPKISPEELISEIPEYEAIMVRSRTKVTSEVIKKGNNITVVGRIGSGFDNIDILACKKRKIRVLTAPDANSQSVAELTVSLIISLLRKTEIANSSMRQGKWLKNEIWGRELNGKTVGILGYGFVGQKVAELLKAFNCRLLIYSLNHKNCEMPELFSKSDIVTIHLTLTNSTKGLVSQEFISKMQKHAYLVNISRGEIVVEKDLLNALKNDKIAGAALDVFWQEPLPEKSEWRNLKNVILTPHIGAATIDALERASMTVAEDLVRLKNGKKPKFQVT